MTLPSCIQNEVIGAYAGSPLPLEKVLNDGYHMEVRPAALKCLDRVFSHCSILFEHRQELRLELDGSD